MNEKARMKDEVGCVRDDNTSISGNLRKIILIGSGGAGKSTLAVELGRLLDLPVIHLDALFWQPGWQEMPRDEWNLLLGDLVKQDAWVMDGNYGGSMNIRLAACDTIIFLNFSRWICMYRLMKRVARHYGRTRPDLAEGCPEQLPDWPFIQWIWTFSSRKAPGILEKLRAYEGEKTVVILRSPAEVKRFLASLEGMSDTSL